MSDSFVRQHWQQTYVSGRFRNGRDQGYIINHVFTHGVVEAEASTSHRQFMDEFSRKGLKSQYEVTDSLTVCNWVRQLISFTMLPVFAIPNWLKYPPATGNTVTDAKLLEIAAHFEHT